MHLFVIAVLACALPADVAPPEDGTVEDLSEFQGRWQLVAITESGRRVPEKRLRDWQWAFQDDKVIHWYGAMVCRQGRFRLDRTTNPPQLFLAFSGGTMGYVFRIHGDLLEVAGRDSAEPPIGFTPEEGCITSVVLRRVHK